MFIGDKIKQIRENKHLSQATVTKLISENTGKDFGANTLRRIEKGQNNPRPETLNKIADALNVSINDMLPNSDEILDLVEKKIGFSMEDDPSINKALKRYSSTDSLFIKLNILLNIEEFIDLINNLDIGIPVIDPNSDEDEMSYKIAFAKAFHGGKDEEYIENLFSQLNDEGQEKLIDYLSLLIDNPKYRVDSDE